jgi:hypothetical protein
MKNRDDLAWFKNRDVTRIQRTVTVCVRPPPAQMGARISLGLWLGDSGMRLIQFSVAEQKATKVLDDGASGS